jgi:hypothetical protein
MLRAERHLARARLTDHHAAAAGTAWSSAIASLREHSTPYHLAHGLLDHARHLSRLHDHDAAAAIEEARTIARSLRCQPLLDRAEAMEPAQPRTRA